MKIKEFLYYKVWRRFVCGLSNPTILFHGFNNYPHTEFWVEWVELERVKYAKENPWVLKYNFGHKELTKKYLEKYKII